jgi:hypothetical protein
MPHWTPRSKLLSVVPAAIIVWAIVAIAVIILVFDLIGCLVGMPRLLR